MKDNCTPENFKCPMCRNKLEENQEEKINTNLQMKIKELFTEEYNEKFKILQEKKLLENSLKKINIIYGNDHKEIKEGKPSNSNPDVENKHSWKMSVELQGVNDPENFIEKVHFKLHPTFKQNLIICKKAPYSFGRIGWGTFDIPITIYWNSKFKMEPLKLNHELNFSGNGFFSKKIMKFDKDLFKGN